MPGPKQRPDRLVTNTDLLLDLILDALNSASTSSAALLAAMQALQDNEFVKVYDSLGVLFYARAVFDSDAGTLVSWTYYNADGTTGSPTGAVSFFGNQTEDPAFSIDTGSGTIAAGKKSFTVYNQGDADGVLDGSSLPAGASVSFAASEGNTLGSMTYDATGTTFLITSIS